MKCCRFLLFLAIAVVLASPKCLGQEKAQEKAQEKRKIILDQDAAGPAGTDQQSMLLLIQSPQTQILGITVVTGDMWLDEELAHTLRMLELIGRTDIPVVRGAENPLIRRRDETLQWEERYGPVTWLGAWTPRVYHPADVVPALREGSPSTKPIDEDAAHFLVRMVRQYPHQVTIYEGGPMTNLALAISIDPEFTSLAKELVFMGGSLNPQTSDPEFANSPRHEFNLWFDPEAAHIVLRAKWRKVVCTPVDISLKTKMTQEMIDRIKQGTSPSAKYIGQYARLWGNGYMWDELSAAAWLDPSIITKAETRLADIDLDRGANYGNLLTWSAEGKPKTDAQPIEIQDDLDTAKLYKLFVDMLCAPAPSATAP